MPKEKAREATSDVCYYDVALWTVENDITSGISATAFSPDITVTRGQVVPCLFV